MIFILGKGDICDVGKGPENKFVYIRNVSNLVIPVKLGICPVILLLKDSKNVISDLSV